MPDPGSITGGWRGQGWAAAGGAQEQGRRRAHLWMLVQTLQDSFTAFEQARMPVLAAVQGGCIGGAVDMVTAADLRYCTEDAFFCVQEINLGMTADVGTLQRLPRLIPEGENRDTLTRRRWLLFGALQGTHGNLRFKKLQRAGKALLQAH